MYVEAEAGRLQEHVELSEIGVASQESSDKQGNVTDDEESVKCEIIGGRSYWYGRAAACLVFGPCGPRLSLARPLSSPETVTKGHSHISV